VTLRLKAQVSVNHAYALDDSPLRACSILVAPLAAVLHVLRPKCIKPFLNSLPHIFLRRGTRQLDLAIDQRLGGPISSQIAQSSPTFHNFHLVAKALATVLTK
jgi:hypothetical protein